MREVIGPLNAIGDPRAASSRTARSRRRRASRRRGRSSTRPAGSRSASTPSTAAPGAPRTRAGARRGDALAAPTPRSTCTRASRYGAAEVIEQFGTPEQQKRSTASACSTASGAARCASPSRTPAPTSARRAPRATTQRRRHATHQRHQDLHLRRRPRPRREHRPPGARARRRRAAGHQGPDALHRARSCASTRTARSASPTTSPSARIEHKMGINGSATCVLNFGENGGCIGELVGGDASTIRACRRCSR